MTFVNKLVQTSYKEVIHSLYDSVKPHLDIYLREKELDIQQSLIEIL